MKYFLLICLSICLYSCNPGSTKEHSSAFQLEEIVAKVDSIEAFNGIIGILEKGKKPKISYHGFKSPLKKDAALDSTDYFHIASNSKLFTGFAILKVLDDYDLNYSDPIAPYFPELNPALQRVTIQQLANHTSAIHDYLSLVDDPVQITNEQALSLITKLDSTVYPPGSQWGYTNSGYVLLSLLVERVTGRNYNDYLRQEILAPLGIYHAQLHPEKVDALRGFENDSIAKIYSLTTGGSGIYLRSQDFVQFFKNLNKMSVYINQADKWSSPWKDDEWRYGFGWFFSQDSLGRFKAHSGKSGGFESYLRVSQNNDFMLFILSNQVNGSAKILRNQITEQLIENNN